MDLLALKRTGRVLLGAMALLAVAAATTAAAQDDPTAEAGRLSYVTGNVSIQPAGVDDWGQAASNLPLGPGDRIYTYGDGRAEIQVGQTFLRVGPNSDVTFVDATPDRLEFGVAQGMVHVHSFGLWQGQALHVNTPSGSMALNQPGEIRVEVPANNNVAIYTNLGNNAWVSGAGGFGQGLGERQTLELVGSNPVYPQWLQTNGPDELDVWSQARDMQIITAQSYRYVSPEMPGAYELDANGSWVQTADYGPVWFPNNVGYGWQPYHNGHWMNHAPWGWVWVEDEPWGYAPFHYGRWAQVGGRWGWLPGPPTAHPVWSPALVAFAGGIQVGGVGVSAWFPLGPGEPYHPWYAASPRYVDQVNITNIRETRVVHVQTTYINIVNVTYVNRTVGVTAMRHEDFAAGRPAARVGVTVNAGMFAHVQVLARPVPQPSHQAYFATAAVAVRPVPVPAARPALINASGKMVIARPGAQAVEAPVRPAQQARPVAGRTVIAPPAGAARQGGGAGQFGQRPGAAAGGTAGQPAQQQHSTMQQQTYQAPAGGAATQPQQNAAPAGGNMRPANGQQGRRPGTTPVLPPETTPTGAATPAHPQTRTAPAGETPQPATTQRPANAPGKPANATTPATTGTKPGTQPGKGKPQGKDEKPKDHKDDNGGK
jgi:hypothetical protein